MPPAPVTPPPVDAAAAALAPGLEIDEDADLVRWTDPDGERRETGLHDYAALYAVPGLYEAVYVERLAGASPQLLAAALAEVVAEPGRARVLDVGCGTGAVGTALRAYGFGSSVGGSVAGTDLEPAVTVAVPRDRPGAYDDVRALDLLAPTDDDRAWLAGVAPDVVTVVGAVGFGHLPLPAFEALHALLPPGGLLAVTVARDLGTDPALAGYAALLGEPTYRRRGSRDGVHRRTADGRELLVTALVLERA